MKTVLVYLLVFLLAFIATTGLVIILNSQYANVFNFDFSSPTKEQTIEKEIVLTEEDYQKLQQYIEQNFKEGIIDSLDRKYFTTKADTIYQVYVKDSSLIQSLDQANQANKNLTMSLQTKSQETDSMKSKLGKKQKEEYLDWLKSTVSLYEAMDVRKAAKLISNYSDNEARDIIYSMKKKKAAEILAQLSAETVQRITRSK
ncbi:MAG: hypothetical protein V1720_01150 [bacterium]